MNGPLGALCATLLVTPYLVSDGVVETLRVETPGAGGPTYWVRAGEQSVPLAWLAQRLLERVGYVPFGRAAVPGEWRTECATAVGNLIRVGWATLAEGCVEATADLRKELTAPTPRRKDVSTRTFVDRLSLLVDGVLRDADSMWFHCS